MGWTAIALWIGGAALACDEPASCLAQARQAVIGGDLEEGRRLYEAACAQGSAEGCTGAGATRDELGLEAWSWLVQGCELGDVVGCVGQGLLRVSGRGTELDVPQGRALLQRACASGSAVGCLQAGLSWELDAPREFGRAASSYSSACGYGSAHACYNLARLVRMGQGAPRDPARELSLWARACTLGHANACTQLGALRLRHSTDAATSTWALACRSGDPEGCLHLGLAVVEPEPEVALAAWIRGCELGGAPSCAEAGQRGREDLAMRGCALGSERACASMEPLPIEGPSEDTGLGPSEDLLRALDAGCVAGAGSGCVLLAELLQVPAPGAAERARGRACELGRGDACAEIARRALEEGARQGSAAVLPWLRQACDAGIWQACTDLAASGALDPLAADALLGVACAEGSTLACVGLAEDALERGLPEARADLEALCEQGSARACLALGLDWLDGRAGPPRPQQGGALLVETCEARHAPSCAALAERFQRGDGLPRSPERARELGERACALDARYCPEPP